MPNFSAAFIWSTERVKTYLSRTHSHLSLSCWSKVTAMLILATNSSSGQNCLHFHDITSGPSPGAFIKAGKLESLLKPITISILFEIHYKVFGFAWIFPYSSNVINHFTSVVFTKSNKNSEIMNISKASDYFSEKA